MEEVYSDSFWREKFKTEGLPLLEEGLNVVHWLILYNKSIQAARVADTQIDSGQAIEIALARVDNLELIKVKNSDIEEVWQAMQINNVDLLWAEFLRTEITATHDYYLLLSPRACFYMYDKIDKQEEQTLLLPSAKIALTRDDAWFFIYRLAYFGYPF